jgi:hypothetical protein
MGLSIYEAVQLNRHKIYDELQKLGGCLLNGSLVPTTVSVARNIKDTDVLRLRVPEDISQADCNMKAAQYTGSLLKYI